MKALASPPFRAPPFRAPAPGAASRGQATVEVALLLPLLAVVSMALVQLGLVVRDQVAVVHAAREAARAAAVETERGRVVRAARRVLAGAEVEMGRRPPVGEPLRVVVRYRSATRLPLVGALLPDPLLRAEAVMRVER